MTFRRLKKVNSSGPDSGGNSQENDIYFPSSKSDSCRTSMDLHTKPSDVYNYKTLAYSGGTLPRNFKKNGGLQKWKPLTQTPEPQRKVVELEKSDEETFGFEIQTYGLHHQDQNTVEMCTFVCKVHEDSPAQRSGLKVETVYSDSIRKAELEARLQYLKQTLHEKWDEYRSLMVQEQRLVHVMSDAAIYESLELAGIYGSVGTPSPMTAPRSIKGTGSTSSSASLLSTTTDDDPLYQTCLYQPDGSVDSDQNNQNCKQKPLRSIQRKLRPASELFTTAKTHLTRSASTRSYTRPQSATITPAEKQGGGFNSLQRKNKPKSFRRRLLKFIPGLNLPLEEEESKL
ncbi:hypothetical protein NL108_016395 [Boleophthalmus pectinirostris]|nr:hypothetical protein NL108_016395 [Boleophthalmus pectinirostris]